MTEIYVLHLISWALLVVPWLTLLFMKKEHIKRYMPVALLGSLLVTLWNEFAYSFNWWSFKTTLVPSLIVNISFVYGVFLVGTIWIFYFTYRKFWLFLLTNIVIDGFLAFPVNYMFEQVGLYRLVNYNSWNIWFTAAGLSVVLYVYQRWQEEVLIKRHEPKGYNDFEMNKRQWIQTKEKAR